MCPVFSGQMSGHRIRHLGSCSFNASLDFYLALYSNSSILGQDVLDIVSDIVDPAASILHLTFYLALCIVQPDLIP